MQQILIDSARNWNRQKRCEGEKPVPIHSIDEASIKNVDLFDPHQTLILNQARDLLAKDHPEACFALTLEFFYGMNQAEIANSLDLSDYAVKKNRDLAFAWLKLHWKKEEADSTL